MESSEKAASDGLLKEILKRKDWPTEKKNLKAIFFMVREESYFNHRRH